ncbi:hypothetical protein V6Z11_D10G138200 [Gossypium hirsutum]
MNHVTKIQTLIYKTQKPFGLQDTCGTKEGETMEFYDNPKGQTQKGRKRNLGYSRQMGHSWNYSFLLPFISQQTNRCSCFYGFPFRNKSIIQIPFFIFTLSIRKKKKKIEYFSFNH